ncbi:peroxisomal membrane anchor protein (Pex14) [Purpureocillium lilacinum]|uniref:Peroxisomal membrane protein PEX14 n=1 Tax=Purpureocillium lilacinum TaxID=33203 RepID=A0A179HR52_PURLI|nr:peroxisomal membrane anchor protein (Pex14) [Purpureocillium lilacinum]OAQ92362.1 peroxisomal membrane anchor protein (Pex14) [Purpureocillium lilacinum]
MAIREDIVASAAQFLQDPSVASSTVENKISFLRTKNLTQEEIDAALARSGGHAPPSGPPAQYGGPPSGPPQPYYQQYPQYAWQPPPPAPRRDWRDWFIMATVVSGVGYGLYSLGKRYVYPLVAPPTPERLEQDKKSIEEQFDKAFALVEQLAKDTEALKTAEQQRTEKLDTAISELDTVMADLKAANRRREDDAQRIRDEVQALKEAIPKAMDNQKTLTDTRLSEINTELTSLKTLVSQRMSSNAAPAAATTGSSYSRPGGTVSGTRVPQPTVESVPESSSASTPAATEPPKSLAQSSFNRPSGSGKASIPAWQMAAANKSAAASSATNGEAAGSEQKEASSSS